MPAVAMGTCEDMWGRRVESLSFTSLLPWPVPLFRDQEVEA